MAKWLVAQDHTGAWWVLPPNRETGYPVAESASTGYHESSARWIRGRLDAEDNHGSIERWIMNTWTTADPPPELVDTTDTCTHCDDPLIRDTWGRWEHEFPQDDINHLAYPRNPYNRTPIEPVMTEPTTRDMPPPNDRLAAVWNDGYQQRRVHGTRPTMNPHGPNTDHPLDGEPDAPVLPGRIVKHLNDVAALGHKGEAELAMWILAGVGLPMPDRSNYERPQR